ncbi:unnamed protein product [Lampetra fluviatilis]
MANADRGRRRATNLPPPILMARSDVVPSFGANLRGAARSLRSRRATVSLFHVDIWREVAGWAPGSGR